MNKILMTLVFLISFSFADSVKQFTLACNSYEDITDTEGIEKAMKNGDIPKNCLFLTSYAKVSVVDDNLNNSQIVKIFIHDLETHMFILKEDVIITNENKI